MRLDAHNYKRRIDRFFEKIKDYKSISEEDKVILKRYRDYLVSENITYGRIGKYLTDLQKAAELLGKPFSQADEEDIRRIVASIVKDEKLSPWTKRDFKIALRKFYTWLRGTKDYPPEVAWFKIHVKIHNQKTHEDMLTEEEVKKLINFAHSFCVRAFISTLYESGCRIGEIIYARLNQLKFDEYGGQLYVTGKTGFRRVRIVSSVPYLTEWINRHPFREDPKAFLWLNNNNKPYGYGTIAECLKRIAQRAGIKKKVNPHNFRHSRATYLANFLTEAQMKEYFGWIQDSKMAGVYVHLSGRNVDNAILKVYGIDNGEEKKESIFKPIECSRCRQVNQATNKFCSRCGLPLDEETKAETIKKTMERKEADDIMDRLLEDQEFREMFTRKLNSLKFGS